jgi:hypothetical protein
MRNKYVYAVYDLEGNLLFIAHSAPEIARKMKVTEDTVYKRIKYRVNKNTVFHNDKTKFNVERGERV